MYNIRLQGGQIELSFTDKKTGKPLKVSVYAMFTWKGAGAQRLYQSGKAGEKILFKNLPNVPMNLRIFSPGYSTYLKAGIYAGASGKRIKLPIVLEPAGKVLLTLKTPNKSVPERPWARVLINGKYQWVPSNATPGGDLLVRSLSPGTAHLQISANGYKKLKITVDVPAKGTGKATFFLIPTSPQKIKKPKPAATSDSKR